MGSPFYIDSVKRQILLPTNIKESSPGKDNFQSLLWKYRCKPYNKRYHRFCIFQYIFRIWNFFLPSINCHWTDFHRMGNPKNIFKIYQIAIGCNLHYMSMLGFHKTHNHLGNLYCMDKLNYAINLGPSPWFWTFSSKITIITTLKVCCTIWKTFIFTTMTKAIDINATAAALAVFLFINMS